MVRDANNWGGASSGHSCFPAGVTQMDLDASEKQKQASSVEHNETHNKVTTG